MSATPTGAVRYFVRDPADDTPAVGAQVYTYIAGTTTPATTWADPNKSGANLNPVITDADGGCDIFGDGAYKFIVKDAAGNLLYEIDGIILGSTAFDRDASGVNSLPFDDIASTNVQAALEELGQKRVKDTDVIDIPHGGTGATTAAAARTALGLAINSDVQAWDADLDAISAFTLKVFSGLLYGLTTSNNGSDATNDIDFAAGVCIDSTNLHLQNCAAMTKRLDANWAAGTNQGMRYSGAAITNTTYHLYVATKADGTQDYYADPSATIATVLAHLQAETGGANYLYLRRIASIVRSGGVIKAYKQLGDRFVWDVAAGDVNTSTTGTAAVTSTLTVPTGIVVVADVNAAWLDLNPGAGTVGYALLTALDQTDTAPSVSAFSLAYTFDSAVNLGGAAAFFEVKVNTSGQIRYRCGRSSADISMSIVTTGYKDTRGRLA
jgi:hypothetical protein